MKLNTDYQELKNRSKINFFDEIDVLLDGVKWGCESILIVIWIYIIILPYTCTVSLIIILIL
jgi:hypothetical protein